MTKDAARNWLIAASLIASGTVFSFFIIAPLLGFPLEFSQSIHLIEIITPVFFGYVGSATLFYFRPSQAAQRNTQDEKSYPVLLVKGPVGLFGLLSGILLLAFHLSNSPDAEPGSGMSVDLLSGAFATLLGLLAITTNVIIAYLFASEDQAT